MESKELRIGNWIQLENYDKYQVEPHHFQLNEDGYSEVLDISKSIPLTEEWLDKFGFEKTEDPEDLYYTIIFDEIANYKFIVNRKLAFGLFTFRHPEFITQIQYVHQLQNLYFALTGEELTATK